MGLRIIRMKRNVYESHATASVMLLTVPLTTSAFRWSGRDLMKQLSMGDCRLLFDTMVRYLLFSFS